MQNQQSSSTKGPRDFNGLSWGYIFTFPVLNMWFGDVGDASIPWYINQHSILSHLVVVLVE